MPSRRCRMLWNLQHFVSNWCWPQLSICLSSPSLFISIAISISLSLSGYWRIQFLYANKNAKCITGASKDGEHKSHKIQIKCMPNAPMRCNVATCRACNIYLSSSLMCFVCVWVPAIWNPPAAVPLRNCARFALIFPTRLSQFWVRVMCVCVDGGMVVFGIPWIATSCHQLNASHSTCRIPSFPHSLTSAGGCMSLNVNVSCSRLATATATADCELGSVSLGSRFFCVCTSVRCGWKVNLLPAPHLTSQFPVEPTLDEK